MKPYGEEVLEAGDGPEEEPVGVDPEGLRALLVQRLEEGASDDAIQEELRQQVPASTLAQWKSLLGWMPLSTAAKALGLERQEREQARKADVARKAILGGAVLAAIRAGRLAREDWDRILWPSLIDRDRQRLKGWPWDSGDPNIQREQSKG